MTGVDKHHVHVWHMTQLAQQSPLSVLKACHQCQPACLQVRKSFGLDHETITQLAEKEPAGSSGVNFLPYITGERTPNWPHSSGVLTGLRPGSMRPGLLYRAAMEGATFSLLAGQQWAVIPA
jgi:sugar (pentulose or hexulose) kinase